MKYDGEKAQISEVSMTDLTSESDIFNKELNPEIMTSLLSIIDLR